jgi:hypothetical protein
MEFEEGQLVHLSLKQMCILPTRSISWVKDLIYGIIKPDIETKIIDLLYAWNITEPFGDAVFTLSAISHIKALDNEQRGQQASAEDIFGICKGYISLWSPVSNSANKDLDALLASPSSAEFCQSQRL